MSTTYLDITNEVLSELNEVLLTTSNFGSATNIQRHVKEAVNRAYFDINNPEHKFPWLATGPSLDDRYGNKYIETVVGTRWYQLDDTATNFNEDFGHVDWERMELTTENVVGAETPYINDDLYYIEVEEWRDHYATAENVDKSGDNLGGKPLRVMRNPDGRRFGLSPIPDKVYRVYFYAWDRPVKLAGHDDLVNLPDQFIHVLVSRARYYAWQRKEHPEQAQIALQDYNQGLRGMRQQSTDQSPDRMTDSRRFFV